MNKRFFAVYAFAALFALVFSHNGFAQEEAKTAAKKYDSPYFFDFSNDKKKVADSFKIIYKNEAVASPELKPIDVLPEKAAAVDLQGWKQGKKKLTLLLSDKKNEIIDVDLEFQYGASYKGKGAYISGLKVKAPKAYPNKDIRLTVTVNRGESGVANDKEISKAYAEIIINMVFRFEKEKEKGTFDNAYLIRVYGDGTIEEDKTQTYEKDGNKIIRRMDV